MKKKKKTLKENNDREQSKAKLGSGLDIIEFLRTSLSLNRMKFGEFLSNGRMKYGISRLLQTWGAYHYLLNTT